jgi:hypothetical protein
MHIKIKNNPAKIRQVNTNACFQIGDELRFDKSTPKIRLKTSADTPNAIPNLNPMEYIFASNLEFFFLIIILSSKM